MTTDVQDYSHRLLYALRLRDVPGPRIAEALAEVHSHVAETGEDPWAAFGAPDAYAGEITAALGEAGAPAHQGRRVAGVATAYGLGATAGTWLLLRAALSWGGGGGAVLGLPPVAAALIGAGLLAALALGLRRLGRHPDVPVLDPRSGADMTPPRPRWVLPVMLTPPLLGIALGGVLLLSGR